MSKGEIIYIGGFELPDKNAAAHRVINIGKILIKIGYSLKYIGINRQGKKIKQEKNSYDSVSVPYPVTNKEWIKYYTDFTHIKDEIDASNKLRAIICYNCPSPILRKILNYAKIKNIKVIADITEWYEDNRLIKSLDSSYRMRLLHKKVDGAICISSYLHDYYNPFVPSIVVPPLVDLNDEKWGLQKFNKSEYVKLIYSGDIGRNKDDLNSVINGILKNKKILFRVVGITKEDFLKNNPNYRKHLNERIVFMGRVSHEKSLEYIKEADFQIFLRKATRMNNAGFPTKFVESMACGTPVITTRTSDLPDYLIEGENGFFVDYGNDNALEEVLNIVSNLENDKIHSMKKYAKAVKKFDYRNYYTDMHDFIKEL